MKQQKSAVDLIWTQTDEAPALASYSLLPLITQVLKGGQVSIASVDISLAGRILAAFPDALNSDQKVEDHLGWLGEEVKTKRANIIKLPNISASELQLKSTIFELQSHGYAIPHYPEKAVTAEEKQIKARYDKIKGSAVNPVLREGNSDRRVAPSVKQDAKRRPHQLGAWQASSKTAVVSMSQGDFYSSEQSSTLAEDTLLEVRFVEPQGTETTLIQEVALPKGAVVDAATLNVSMLKTYLQESLDDAKKQGVSWSLHLKATMMKVSDPILFGHGVEIFFKPLFDRFATEFAELGITPRAGLAELFEKIKSLPNDTIEAIMACYRDVLAERPPLAMVNSDRGITNLHRSNDVIIDASMPAMIKNSGCMWDEKGAKIETKALIPDRCYAGIYAQVIEDCKKHGAFDPTTMGNVANVGLMAQKAQEYGSHDKTFEMPAEGKVVVKTKSGQLLFEHQVAKGDIWRMCTVQPDPIANWIALGLERARLTGRSAIFWLDPKRAHDRQLITSVESVLAESDLQGLDIQILSPQEAMQTTLEKVRAGQDVIAITGNVLRDYLTDLFPILELGTSAKMLSIVPLMEGGGLFETGAGGSAPKHVEQFVNEGYLRWDSLGEFLALTASLEHLARQQQRPEVQVMAQMLDQAIDRLLKENKLPQRKLGTLDSRGSHFFLILYWVQALAAQVEAPHLAMKYQPLAQALSAQEAQIAQELIDAQDQAIDLAGYYQPCPEKAVAAMRPSVTLNAVMAEWRG
jgi:isocitrate dehydrogenase